MNSNKHFGSVTLYNDQELNPTYEFIAVSSELADILQSFMIFDNLVYSYV